MNEFELIRNYFASQPVTRGDTLLGIGDDAAVIQPPAGMDTVVTTDVLAANVHFFENMDPAALGHKSLAVNLSDLAAMGAMPAWFLLDLTLPEADPDWLGAFAGGLFSLAQRYDVQLIGGDTARGPLSVAITAIGLVPEGKCIRRRGARPGDVIYVTGVLGDAALTLAALRGERALAPDDLAAIRDRMDRPTPRVTEGIALRGQASSAIDISDGLTADLGHILRASDVGARLNLGALPLSAAYRKYLPQIGWDYALAGGDDYELCVTVPPGKVNGVDKLAAASGFSMAAVGEITVGRTLEIYDALGRLYEPQRKGFEHFAQM
jgi:thiamine-monophosphate kinase